MIEKIQRINPIMPNIVQKPTGITGEDKPDFGQMLKDAIDQVNDLQKTSDKANIDYAAGKITDVHQVMIAAEKASLSLSLTKEVTNKIVEAYKEITRMQI